MNSVAEYSSTAQMQEADTTEVVATVEAITAANDVLTEPVDVLVLTNKPDILPQVARMLSLRGLTYIKMPADAFSQIHSKLALIGTVIIDAAGLTLTQQKNLLIIVDALEVQHIATILLNSLAEAEVGRHTLSGKLYSATLEELAGRVQANIAYRKRISAIATNTQPKHEDATVAKALMTDMMTEQLKLTGRVQRDFLPSHLPNTEKIRWATLFNPAEWVSGDIYDIARLDQHHIGFYLADAVGHSLPAAILTIFLKHELVMRETDGITYKIFEPVEVIQNLNRRMTQQKLSGCQFATCCYCLLNTDTLKLTFARGGHPYPVLVRQDGSIRQLQIRGPLLGIFEQAEYQQEGVQLEKGDKLFLYSDGVEPLIGKVDTQSGFIFTDEFQSVKHLPVKEAVDALNAIIAKTTFAAAETDDITIVGLEIL